METEQIETEFSKPFIIIGFVIVMLSLYLAYDLSWADELSSRYYTMSIVVTSLIGGVFVMSGLKHFILLKQEDKELIQKFYKVGSILSKKELNVEVVNELSVCSKQKTALEVQLNDYKMKIKRLEDDKVNQQTDIEGIKKSFQEYKDSFPREDEIPDCQSLQRVILIRTRMLNKLIKQDDSLIDSYKTQKSKLDTLLLVLKGKIPKGSIGNDFHVQQSMGQQIWGLCKDLKDQEFDPKGESTEWQPVGSTVSSSDGVPSQSKSLRVDTNMKGS